MITVIGIGPGDFGAMTLDAKEALAQAQAVVGYKTYMDLIRPLLKEDQHLVSNGMRGEIQRVQEALRIAREGTQVAVISSGDAGVYGMAGLVLEMLKEEDQIEVRVIPGVTASSAAAAVLGAPLMHDFCHISLSDLLTPYDTILKRVELAAQADFVICFYNPRSKGRPHNLEEAFQLIRRHKKPETPVGVVTDATRANQKVSLYTLETMNFEEVGMTSIVIVGNHATYIKGQGMITPRGYEKKKGFES